MSGLSVGQEGVGLIFSKQELEETLRARSECFRQCSWVQTFVGSWCTEHM